MPDAPRLSEGGGSVPPEIRAWLGDPGPKRAPGSEHGPDPARTFERFLPVARGLGVTRVADITGLDDIGIPVATAYRPNARSLAVSQGKGPTLAAARTSALMEAVEAAHAEQPHLDLLMAREAELQAEGKAVASPAALPRRVGAVYDNHQAVLWTEGRDLFSGAPTWVPYDAVHLDLTLTGARGSWALPGSNGLASGNTVAEAVCHALCELIERDATTLWEMGDADRQAATRVDPATVGDPLVDDLLDHYDAAGVEVALYDVTSDLGVPVVLCHIADREPNPFRPLPPAGGAGCHLHPGTAVLRALTEAAQTRLIDIAGARDDLSRREQRRRLAAQRPADRGDALGSALTPLPPGTPGYRPLGDRHGPDGLAGDWVEDDIATLLGLLDRAGMAAVAVDLSRAELGIPVVRVVVPGLEGMPAAMAGGTTPGQRAMAAAEPVGERVGRSEPARVTWPSLAPRPGPPVVFVGPTVPADRVRERLDAEIRPPAAQGDVAREIASGPPPAAVVLIDGSYEAVPAVWHKEILWAMSRGVPVYGAASMGALRAAELASFGMVGVGEIFDALMAGGITSDDEVAVAHAGPDDRFRPLSVALVDVRATLATAVHTGVVAEPEAETVAATARRLFYPQRVWPTVLDAAVRDGLSPSAARRLRTWVAGNALSRKQADAEAVLDRVARDSGAPDRAPGKRSGQPVPAGTWRLERTEQWQRAEALLGVGAVFTAPSAAGGGGEDRLSQRTAVTGDDLLDELRLVDAYHRIHQACLVAELAAGPGTGEQAVPGGAESEGAAVQLLREGLGLQDDASLAHWLAENEVTEIDLPRLATHQADLVAAHNRGHDGAVRRVVDHLRLRGRFPRLVAETRAKQQALDAVGLAEPDPATAGVSEAELWRWYFTRTMSAPDVPDKVVPDATEVPTPEGLEAHAHFLGFEDGVAFRRAVLRAWCYEVRLSEDR